MKKQFSIMKPTVIEPYALDIELLLDVLYLQNPSRDKEANNETIARIRELLPPGCRVATHRGAMIISKGVATNRPYFLAHLDQVHDKADGFTVLVDGDGHLIAVNGDNEQVGIGGDDKSGIYVALHMLHVLDNVTAVFVPDEEVGCIGSSKVRMRWFRNASFVMQFDRRHDDYDVIRYTNSMECASDEFMEALEKMPINEDKNVPAWDYEAIGSVTDVGEIASRGLKVSGVNVSAGYHDAHSDSEYIVLKELAHSVRFAYEAATLLGNERWPHTATPHYGGSWKGGYSSGYTNTAWGGYASGYCAPRVGAMVYEPRHKGLQYSSGSESFIDYMNRKERLIKLCQELARAEKKPDAEALAYRSFPSLLDWLMDFDQTEYLAYMYSEGLSPLDVPATDTTAADDVIDIDTIDDQEDDVPRLSLHTESCTPKPESLFDSLEDGDGPFLPETQLPSCPFGRAETVRRAAWIRDKLVGFGFDPVRYSLDQLEEWELDEAWLFARHYATAQGDSMRRHILARVEDILHGGLRS